MTELSDDPIQVKAPASVTRRACFRQLVGAWAIEDTALSGYVEQLRGMDMETVWAENRKLGDYPIYSPAAFALIEDLQAGGHEVEAISMLDDDEDERRGPPPYVRVGPTAVIPVSGPLSKHPSSLSHRFGGSSTAGMRQALQMALGDKKVERVMFHIDSPGGTVAGTGDLGDDIARANAVKPTAAFVEDLGASAALWIASQTGHIYASRHAEVGSIGVIQVVHDTSKMAEKAGIEVHVIKSGPYKGGPVPGTKVTDAQKKEMQSTISTIHDQFVRTVAEGRGLSVESIAAIADGRVFQAPRAKELGLVDTISTFSGALSHFAGLRVDDVQRRSTAPPADIMAVSNALESPEVEVEANHQPLNTAENLATTRSHMADSPPDTQDAAPKSIEAGAENDLAAMRAEFASLKAEFAAEKQAKAAAEQKRVEALQATLKERFDVSDRLASSLTTVEALEATIDEMEAIARTKEAGGRGSERGIKTDEGKEHDPVVIHERLQSDMEKSAKAFEARLMNNAPLSGELTVDGVA